MSAQEASDLIAQGYRFFEQGRYQAAIGCFTQAADLARRGGHIDSELNALGYLPDCWANLGDSNKMAEAATRLLTRARQVDNREYEALAGLRLASALARIDLPTRWQEIRQVLLDGLQTARQLGEDWYVTYHLMRLGGYAREVGELEDGYRWLQDALNTLTPTTKFVNFFRSDIYGSMSQLMKQRNDRAEALRYAEMSLGEMRKDGNPDFITDAQLNLARILRWRGERAEALVHVEEALATSRRLQLDDDIVEGLALKARLLMELGLVEQAQTAYAELWSMTIQNPDCYQAIGLVAYKTMHDLAGAETACRHFLEGRGNHPDGHNKLALVLFDQGRVAEAVRSWRMALTYRNEFPEALAGLALGLWTLGERTEALAVYAQAEELRPGAADPDYLDETFNWSHNAIEGAKPVISVYNATNASRRNPGRVHNEKSAPK